MNICFYQVERTASYLSKDQQAESKEETQGGANNVSGESCKSQIPNAKHDTAGQLLTISVLNAVGKSREGFRSSKEGCLSFRSLVRLR